jgi:hypothetical protein
MKKFPLFASLIVLGMGTLSMLRTGHQNPYSRPNETVAQNTNAAFRDGLYLGKLAAEHGAQPHVASGRWATVEDRSSFTAGYQRGYGQIVASREAPNTRGRAE